MGSYTWGIYLAQCLTSVSIRQMCVDDNEEQDLWGAQAALQEVLEVPPRGSPSPTSPHQLQSSTDAPSEAVPQAS